MYSYGEKRICEAWVLDKAEPTRLDAWEGQIVRKIYEGRRIKEV